MPVRRLTDAEIRAGRRRLELALFLTIFLASAMFCLAERNVPFFLVSLAAVLLHAIAAWRSREIYAHRLLLNAGVMLVGTVLAVRYFIGDEDLLIALGHYVTLIQLCKLFERKRDRDYVQMLVMSLLLVLAASMMCQDLLFALLGLAYLVGLCYTGMVFTLKRSLDAAVRQQASGPGPAPAPADTWPKRAILLRLAVVIVATLATGVVVFLISPRGAGGAGPPLGRVRRRAASGFSDTVRLGRPRSIYLSDRIVMHMRLRSPEGTDLGQVSPPYLRGRVFSEYLDSRWRKSPWARSSLPPDPAGDLLERAVRQEVSMVPSLLPVAFATHPAVRITSPDATPRRLGTLEYELKASPRLDRPVRYTAYVLPDPRGPRVGEYLRTEVEKRLRDRTRFPPRVEVSPKVTALARQWCADLLSRRGGVPPGPGRDEVDLAMARRLAGRLQQRCSYTLDLTDADADRDGVEDFLFHLRRGHCEYFASATTVMCRAVGLRARLATGFRPNEYDDDARRYVVRQRDAHAWTEVYTPSRDWVIVDATPPERFDPPRHGALGRWWSAVREGWTKWEFAWYANVIGYDDDARRALAAAVRAYLRQALRAARRAARAVFWGLVELFARGRISEAVVWFFVGVAVAAGVLAPLGLLLVRRRRGRTRRARDLPAPKPPAFLLHLLALLRRRGLTARPSHTARELADEAVSRFGLPVAELDALVDLYYRIRWAGAPAGRDELHDAERRVRRLADLLAR